MPPRCDHEGTGRYDYPEGIESTPLPNGQYLIAIRKHVRCVKCHTAVDFVTDFEISDTDI